MKSASFFLACCRHVSPAHREHDSVCVCECTSRSPLSAKTNWKGKDESKLVPIGQRVFAFQMKRGYSEDKETAETVRVINDDACIEKETRSIYPAGLLKSTFQSAFHLQKERAERKKCESQMVLSWIDSSRYKRYRETERGREYKKKERWLRCMREGRGEKNNPRTWGWENSCAWVENKSAHFTKKLAKGERIS